MIKLYFTLKILAPIILISLFLIYVIRLLIKHKLDIKYKKNCYKCKQYKLYDVSSCGNGCRYQCSLKNRTDYHEMNDQYNFVKCKEFEDK